MAYVRKIFEDNFIHYASYVIKDRAIPDMADGLKPVQRRILHSLFEMDDGKFHKVANVVGHCMKYHPHGDASIGSALVVLANKDLFIDKQGNYGNIYTGDEASAARYIECKASPLAKEIFHNPKITEFIDSYDGRNREPVAFPAKLPVVLLMGAEGIAVGMSTKILPHNPVEVIKAEIAFLQGKPFALAPDFPTGGIADLSDYRDGAGKVRVRAKLDTSDPKRIVIREVPFGSTTESLIASVEAASRAGSIKIASISDFTTEKVEIEIKLQRGVYTDEVIDALYAFTECEQSISCNCLVIKDGKPLVTTVSDIVRAHSGSLLSILRRELELERSELLDDLHARTLERIFIEERVYKKIEDKKTQEAVAGAVRTGLAPYAAEIGRPVTPEDIERLLKIPIRRISLYDINKARDEMDRIRARLAEVEAHLAALVEYAIGFLKDLARRLEGDWKRRTEIRGFGKVDAREAARRDLGLRYDAQTGYIGTAVSSGDRILDVSAFDKILVVRRTGIYTVVPVPEKMYVDQGLLWCAIAEKDEVSSTVLTIVYRSPEGGHPYIKRTSIPSWIMGKDYPLVPDGARILLFSVEEDFEFLLRYAPAPRTRIHEARFRTKNYPPKGIKAAGVRLATRDALSAESPAARHAPTGPDAPELSQDIGSAGTNGSAPAASPGAASEAAAKARSTATPSTRAKASAKAKPTAKATAPVKESVKAPAKPKSKAPAKVKAPEAPSTPEAPAKIDEPTREGGLLAALARKKAQLEGTLFPDDES